MTAKDKAKELVSKMYIEYKPSEDDASGVYVFYMNLEIAKRCALIAVDEILNSNPCCEDSDRGGNFQWASNEYYWQEVKQEIQNL
jgi:hypothetical protein